MKQKRDYGAIVAEYVDKIISGQKPAGDEIVLRCKRYINDRRRSDLEFKEGPPVARCRLIESIFLHEKGEDREGRPLRGKPFILDDWEIFIIWNIWGFYKPGTIERRYKEALIFVPRKNGKTSLAGRLGFAAAMLQRKSGSEVLIGAAALDQSLKSFQFIKYSLDKKGITRSKAAAVKDNSFEHSIRLDMKDSGNIYIKRLANNPKKQDSYNCNIAILDEIQAFSTSGEYARFIEAQAAYTNRLTIGITSAGDKMNSFGYRHLERALKVVNGTRPQDSFFRFIARAKQDKSGYVDYTDPLQHERANPGYNKSIKPSEIEEQRAAAELDPQKRKDFLSRRLNIYTSATTAYFNLQEFINSDGAYNWSVDQLAKIRGVRWYGGADLSRMHDLTAARLVGKIEDVTVIIPHAFFPRPQARAKANEDNIPLYGWEEDGWLTMSNAPTVNYSDVVRWFEQMRIRGFNIVEVGYDRQYRAEFIEEMIGERFQMVEQPQYHRALTPAFRHVEKARKDGLLYYCHSDAFRYCVENVRAIDKQHYIAYDKSGDKNRIDIFDASVFRCCRMLEGTKGQAKKEKINKWFSQEQGGQ